MAALVAGAGLLAACTSGTEEPDALPTTSQLEEGETISEGLTETFPSPDATDFEKLLPSEDDLVELRPVEILNVETEEPSGLIVAFEMESHHCHGINAAVEETTNEVIVELQTGLRPDVDPSACEYGIFPYTTSITLAEPLGNRTVVPAEPREPAEDTTSGDESATASDPTDTDPADPGTDTTDPADTDTTEPTTEPDPTTSDDSTATSDDDELLPLPDEQGGSTPEPIPGAASLVGGFIEDGVEWALDNGLEWRVLSFDGEPFATDGPDNPERISFVVEQDRIVSYEWS